VFGVWLRMDPLSFRPWIRLRFHFC
jgi:hypothetical protein